GRKRPGIALFGELVRQDVFDLTGDVVDETGKTSGSGGDVRVTGEHSKPGRVLLHVAQQGQCCLLDPATRVLGGEGLAHHVQEGAHLPVDNDRVDALLATEVLIDHGFGDACPCGDFLHGRCVEPAFGEQLPTDLHKLLPTLFARHALAAHTDPLIA